MDLHDKIKRNSNQDASSYAPFRQSGADRGAYLPSSNRQRNPNRQAPHSVQYQPEAEENFVQEQAMENTLPPIQPQNTFVPEQQSNTFAPIQPIGNFQSDNFFSSKQEDVMSFTDTVPATPVLPNFSSPPPSFQETQPAQHFVESQKEEKKQPCQNKDEQNISQAELNKIEKDFFDVIESLFERYEIDKVLIVENRIYTVNFTGDEDSEIFDETIDKTLLDNFTKYFVADGYFETLLNNGCKLEMTYKPVSPLPTIVASKTNSDFFVDEEFVAILFEFLSKGKNVVMLSNFAIDSMYKIVADFFNNNLCITINEPIKTENNVSFRENPLKPSLKTVYSIAKKIEPDNTLIYSPSDLLSTISYMKKNNSVVLFSDTDTPSDFINADVIHALGGQSEYNRISILKAVDIVFTVVPTKNGTIKYTATQLLSPTNKSHVNKIKRIIGDAEIDANKIYFSNVFEKEA